MSSAKSLVTEQQLRQSVEKLDEQFPTEEDCCECIYMHMPGGVRCSCGNPDLNWEYGARTGWCPECQKVVYLTAGSFLHNMRNARPWVLSIKLLEQGIVFSASMFAKVVGIASSSASAMLKKIHAVIDSYLEQDATLVPAASFEETVCKRSRETPARLHPLAEQDDVEAGARQAIGHTSIEDLVELSIASIFQADSNQNAAKDPKYENEKKIYALLSINPVGYDKILAESKLAPAEVSSALSILEIGGLVERLPGNRYKHTRMPLSTIGTVDESKLSKVNFRRIKQYIQNHFHGISRKYLQFYLASYWCFIDRKMWSDGELLKACLRSPFFSYANLSSFVTPLLVQIHETAC